MLDGAKCSNRKRLEYPLWVLSIWKRVDRTSPNECWPWLGAKRSDGYGEITRRPKVLSAHRVIWEICNGKIPVGMCVLHKCDNRICVNPAHLFLGTKADNHRDMVLKGRNLMGENHPNAKLKEWQAREILDRIKKGETQRGLAKEFGVCEALVSSIKSDKKWRHLR
jgi:hypothetical protein